MALKISQKCKSSTNHETHFCIKMIPNMTAKL